MDDAGVVGGERLALGRAREAGVVEVVRVADLRAARVLDAEVVERRLWREDGLGPALDEPKVRA